DGSLSELLGVALAVGPASRSQLHNMGTMEVVVVEAIDRLDARLILTMDKVSLVVLMLLDQAR
ncbi:hypothetical protein Hamer_G026940, partial [Homarus americanus]